MTIEPIYHQVDCIESNKLDLRQANAVRKYKHDIIIFEYPNNNNVPDMEFNNFEALKKPKRLYDKMIKNLSGNILKIHPWVKADQFVWENINELWNKNHQVLLYRVDAPSELTREWLDVWMGSYPCIEKNWIWWVKIYLREKIMAKNIKYILNNYKEKNNPNILIFLQSFHWEHVRFLLTNPTKNEIWKYYFGNFREINKKNIGNKIKKINKVFYKYWNEISDF